MEDNDWFDLAYNERTGDFENCNAKSESELIYNCETDEYEDPNNYEEGEVPSFLLASYIAPPKELSDLIADTARHVVDRYRKMREESIQECEADGIQLTSEQIEDLFDKRFDEP